MKENNRILWVVSTIIILILLGIIFILYSELKYQEEDKPTTNQNNQGNIGCPNGYTSDQNRGCVKVSNTGIAP